MWEKGGGVGGWDEGVGGLRGILERQIKRRKGDRGREREEEEGGGEGVGEGD
jgi:hypothetical protein